MHSSRTHDSETCAALISSRESPSQVAKAVQALQSAQVPTIDVLVNGNADLAAAVADLLKATGLGSSKHLRVWALRLGDKAHALNEYLHHIWPGLQPVLFVDGYVKVRPDAPLLLRRALDASPDALAAAAMPTAGPGSAALARAMRADGGLHGNLFLVSAPAAAALKDQGFRLPLGLYRTDATLGAALSFNLAPARHPWEPLRRIVLVEGATWDIDQQPWWQWQNWRTRWRRLQRQAQGMLENRAVRNLFAERGLSVASLPHDVRGLIEGWRQADGESFNNLLRRPGVRGAWQRLNRACDWTTAQASPCCLLDLRSIDPPHTDSMEVQRRTNATRELDTLSRIDLQSPQRVHRDEAS